MKKQFIRKVKYTNTVPITTFLQIPIYCFTIGYSLGKWSFVTVWFGMGIILISMLIELYLRREVWYEERTKKVV